ALGPRIWLRDLGADASQLVSRGDGANGKIPAPAAYSSGASLNGDGSKVAYSTQEDGLGSGDLYEDDFDQALMRDMTTQTNVLLARPSGSGSAPVAGNGDNASSSASRALSADGRYVAFTSAADRLVVGDDDHVLNVYRRDTLTGETVLVSRATGASGAPGNGDSEAAAISDDGRRVAFTSRATNLGGGELRQVYVRDVVAGTTVVASRATGAGGAIADGMSWDAALSADGKRVAFTTQAQNLGGATGDFTVYVRDLASGTTILAGRGDGADGVVPPRASHPALDADGSHVAFETSSSVLDPKDTGGDLDVYVRDLGAKTTVLASSPTESQIGNGNSHSASLDADGDTVAFVSGDYLHDDEQVYVQRLASPMPAVVVASRARDDDLLPPSNDEPSLDAAGDRVAFVNWEDRGTVYLRDLSAGTTTLVSRASGTGPAADGDAEAPAISAGGECVAFTARARTLGGGYAGDFAQVWRRAIDGDCPTVEQEPVVEDDQAPPAGGPAPSGDAAPPAGGPAAPPADAPKGSPPASRPRITVTRIKRARGGRGVTVTLRCDPAARCTGTVRLAVGRVKLGRALVALRAGKQGTVNVKLGARARAALAQARGKRITVTVTVAGGAKATARLRLR
ncbi:MAG TPA: hypothetical protein VF587_14275, partial [Solirubrobacteraceae bacterium]